MMYLFRIENNLFDSSVSYTLSKKKAIQVMKRNRFVKGDFKGSAPVHKMDTDIYSKIIGSKMKFPTPREIIEFGLVRRFKIK